MKADQQFRKLLEKYKNGSLSKDELKKLAKIYSEHKELEFVLNSDVQDEWTGDPKRSTSGKERKLKTWHMAAMAASVALLIGFFFLQNLASPDYLEYVTAYGERTQVELPDGSTVMLNANTQLRWDTQWKKQGKRRVEISGEAFFDVQHFEDNTEFIVETDKVDVHVTGTSFNVRERSGEIEVFLSSGKVNLEIEEIGKRSISMTPGNEVVYLPASQEVITTASQTLAKSASWVEGRLDFENEYLPEILESFEELFGVDFVISNETLLDKRMDLSLPYSSWDLLKQALEISLSVEFTESEDKIIVQ